jgi:hypothetical protein
LKKFKDHVFILAAILQSYWCKTDDRSDRIKVRNVCRNTIAPAKGRERNYVTQLCFCYYAGKIVCDKNKRWEGGMGRCKKGVALPDKAEALGAIQPGDKIERIANEEIKDGGSIRTK